MMDNNCVIELAELHSEEQIKLLNDYDVESLHIEKVKMQMPTMLQMLGVNMFQYSKTK